MATCNTEYFIGQGKVYIAPRTSGGSISGGWTELGDTEKLEVTTKQNFIDEYESCSGNRSIALHIPTQTDWALSVDAKSFSKENLARAFYGTATAVASGSATAEAVTAYALNQIIPLKKADVSTVVVKKGATTLVKDTDYTLDAKNGTITIISGTNTGAFPAALTVDYAYAAQEVVQANTQTISEYAIRFQGINLATKKEVIADLHRVSLDLSQALSLIGIQVNKFTMGGMLLPDPDAGTGESGYLTIRKVV